MKAIYLTTKKQQQLMKVSNNFNFISTITYGRLCQHGHVRLQIKLDSFRSAVQSATANEEDPEGDEGKQRCEVNCLQREQ